MYRIIFIERETVRLLFAAKLRVFAVRSAYTSVLAKISPFFSGPEVGSRDVRKVESCVSERKQIKDGVLLKEEKKEKNRRAKVNRSFSPAELYAHSRVNYTRC